MQTSSPKNSSIDLKYELFSVSESNIRKMSHQRHILLRNFWRDVLVCSWVLTSDCIHHEQVQSLSRCMRMLLVQTNPPVARGFLFNDTTTLYRESSEKSSSSKLVVTWKTKLLDHKWKFIFLLPLVVQFDETVLSGTEKKVIWVHFN